MIEMTEAQKAWFWVGKKLCDRCAPDYSEDTLRYCVVDPQTGEVLRHNLWPSSVSYTHLTLPTIYSV